MLVEEKVSGSPDLKVSRNRVIAGFAKISMAAVFAILAYYGLFQLPFQFPPRQRLWSTSYAFGFNNTVAILVLAVLLGMVAVLLGVVQRYTANSRAWRLQFRTERNPASGRSCLIGLFAAAGLYAVLTFVMYRYSVISAPWLMWEVRHLLYRTSLMEIYGLRPYIDFHVEYGPLLTYAPSCVYRLLEPLGLSLEQAYFVAHFLLNVGGLCCASYLFSRVVMPDGARLISFGVLAIAGFAPYMGLNGVLLRYLGPFASLLAGHVAVARMLSRPKRPVNLIGLVLVILILFTVNILLSAEVAVAFAIAWVAYSVLLLPRDRSIFLISLIALTICGLLCLLLLPPPYYSSLLRFSAGAVNLPLVPAPHLLLYVLTMFLVVPGLLTRSIQRSTEDDITSSAISAALGALCVLMAAGALGRCDLPHVLFYGMGASLLLMARLANSSRAAFTAYTLLYVGIFIVLMQIVNLQVFYAVPPRTLGSRHGLGNAVRRVLYPGRPETLDQAKLSVLDRYPRLGLPFATFEDQAVERYVVTHGKLEPEYYVGIVGVYSAAALERKLRDVARSEYLLVPSGFATLQPRNPCAEALQTIQQWFFYSANFTCRADPLDPFGEVNKFVVEHYVPAETIGSLVVLRRRSTTAPAALQ
jgi:hypothetical protein